MSDKQKKYMLKIIVSDCISGHENRLGFAGEVCTYMNELRAKGAKCIRTFSPVIDNGKIYHVCYIESEEEV